MTIERRLDKIEKRNKRIELDKSWEISYIRKILISVFTYFIIVLFFVFAELPRPFVNSIVPSVAFIISTLSLPLFKRAWIKRTLKFKN
ncbi:MAG: hypothetical protein U9Q99_01950 [Nanoarchaeota archaeon]|nr:hypothetical protein [Nanoarchaeota archaeon]